MKIAISGAGGMIGSALKEHFESVGATIVPIQRVRQKGALSDAIAWHPDSFWIDRERLEKLDAVIHLAGENIAARWTAEKKRRILDSREQGTRLIADGICRLASPPKVFFCASGINYYGDRDGEVLHEGSSPGNGFLAEVCRRWEEASYPVTQKDVRLVNLRFGPVLSRRGGILAKLLPVFRSGMGGRAGSGKQFISWVSCVDVVRAIEFILNRDEIAGPVNVVSPGAVTNKEFAGTLAKVLGRPARIPAPATALRLTMGDMAREMILASLRVRPEKLRKHGFEFRYPELEAALRHTLQRQSEEAAAG